MKRRLIDMTMTKTAAAVLSVALGLSACSMDPVYHRPAAPIPTSYPGSTSQDGQAGGTSPASSKSGASATTSASGAKSPSGDSATAVATDWRTVFKDPRLQEVIALTLENNRDLRVAALQVREYEAQYRIARAALAPTIDATATHDRVRSGGVTTSSSSVQLGTSSWELDFFGRLRSLKNQALETYLSSDASRRSTQLSLISTTATDYLTWLSDRALLKITRDTVESDRKTYETTLRVQQLGNSTMLDVQEAKISLASAESSLASYQRAVEQDRNNLIAAIGGPLPAGFPEDDELRDDMMLADVPAGLPSDLLTRRPDIVAAEHTLKSANAYVGAARAAFFPTISLTATAGTSSSQLSGLFKAGTGAWAFEPSISLPIFDYGNLKASLDVAKVEKDIDIANYEKAIQTAFKEVANGLAGRAAYVDQLRADAEYLSAAQSYYTIAKGRYDAGLDSFLTLLTAQRTLYTAQTQQVTDRLGQQSNLVTLYIALGGGWE
jgi:multidrug efflux system outer membrane protein